MAEKDGGGAKPARKYRKRDTSHEIQPGKAYQITTETAILRVSGDELRTIAEKYCLDKLVKSLQA